VFENLKGFEEKLKEPSQKFGAKIEKEKIPMEVVMFQQKFVSQSLTNASLLNG
jgi:hypothetical protein